MWTSGGDTRRVDRLRCDCEDLDTLGLHQEMDGEGAAGLTLTVQAMTAIDEERLQR